MIQDYGAEVEARLKAHSVDLESFLLLKDRTVDAVEVGVFDNLDLRRGAR